ncbi:hypothetical protein PR048_030632 [Dryococelus australis]|uniref:Uncharacterized protein n=1 Tax=Dryococelus australis TaxID=614101 RepID=A0ABQ9GDB4_9NEOP|nr:hypothetical protein PR048_030632 [Dryococelus australis]
MLASHQGDPGSIPGFSHVGIVPDDAVGGRVFPDLPPPPVHSFWRCAILTSITAIGSQDLDVKSRSELVRGMDPNDLVSILSARELFLQGANFPIPIGQMPEESDQLLEDHAVQLEDA